MIEKSTKKKGCIALILGASCALFGAVSALGNTNDAYRVLAEEYTHSALIKTQATVAAENGVRISSDTAYTADVQGVFKGNTSFTFDFPETGNYNAGNFIFTFTDVANPDASFNVEYYMCDTWGTDGYTGAAVNYKQNYRSSRYWDPAGTYTWYNSKKTGTETVYSLPSLMNLREYTNGNQPTELDGSLALEWDDDVLHVKAQSYNQWGNVTMRTIAAFDGTATFAAGTSWGLPKMPFEYGFTLSVSSSFNHTATEDKGSDVTFKSITTGGTAYDLSQVSASVPDFYNAYINKKEIVIAEHEDFSALTKKDKIIIPSATWQASASSGEVTDIKVVSPTGEKSVSAGDEYAFSQMGEHKLVYTVGDSVEYIRFDVKEYVIKATERFNVTGADVNFVDGKDGAGVEIASTSPYSGEIDGIFQGDTAFNFKFTDESEEYIGGNFVFRIMDAVDESKYFDVEYSVVVTWGANQGYTGAFVNYQGEYRSSQYWNEKNTWYNMQLVGNSAHETVYCGPNFLKRNHDLDGKLTLDFDENGVLSVSVSSFRDSSSRVIAAFDGTDTFVSGTSWGLPKLSFENGFKVLFSSSFAGAQDKASDVLFKSIETSGTTFSFAQNAMNATYDFRAEFKDVAHENEDVYLPQGDTLGNVQGVYSIKANGAEWIVKKVDISLSADTSKIGESKLTVSDDSMARDWKTAEKEYTLHVETPYTVTFDTNGGKAIPTILYSDHTQDRIVIENGEKLFWLFDGWYIDGNLFDGNVSGLYGKNVTLVAAWKDVTAPTVSLVGIGDIVTAVKNQSARISLSDVKAEDAAQNDSVSVVIEVKEPNGNFTAVSDGYTLNFTQTGVYQIRYTAKDGANLTASVVREIKVIDRKSPTMNVSGDYQTNVFEGASLTLASVTAKDQEGTALAVNVSVVKDGKAVEVKNGAFEAIEAGVYVVTYTAQDSFALQGIYTYEVQVLKDDVAPVITTTLQDQKVAPDTKISVPTANVSDNVADGIQTTVSVSYGVDKVDLVNGEFTAEYEGVYTVTYEATDKAGNKTQKVVLITVQAAIENGNESEESGCGSIVSGAFVTAFMAMGAIVLLTKRKEQE